MSRTYSYAQIPYFRGHSSTTVDTRISLFEYCPVSDTSHFVESILKFIEISSVRTLLFQAGRVQDAWNLEVDAMRAKKKRKEKKSSL